MYSVATGKSGRPPRPMLQLAVPANQLEASHGQVILMIKMNMMMRLTMIIIHAIIVDIVFFITIIIRIRNTTVPFTATSGRTTTL